MVAPRRSDVVLDSVKRLLRIGATANLLNLLQKQHPADLAQIFGALLDTERSAVFALLVERQPKLAMETISEMGPEPGALLLTGRSAEDIAKLLHELPSDDAAALIDYLPEELSREVLELMRRKESGQVESLLEYGEQTAGRIMNPAVFALNEDLTVGEAITALQGSRDVEMVFYLYVVDVRRHLVGVTSLRRLLLVSPETPLKRIMTPDVMPPTTCSPFRSSTKRISWPASSPSTTSSTSSRMKPRRTCCAWPACRATSGFRRRRRKPSASGCRGWGSTSSRPLLPPRSWRCSKGRSRK